MSAFQILTYNILTITSEPVEWEEFSDPKFRPKEFLLLLKDLNLKLNNTLLSSKSKKGFPGKAKTTSSPGFSNLNQLGATKVASIVIPLMVHLCAHIEVIASYFDNVTDVNDGIRDAPGLLSDECFPVYNACLEQTFEAFKTILSWNGLPDQLPLLKQALGIFANRLKKANNDTLKGLTEEALKYLERFKDIILNIGCASAYLRLIEVIDGLGDLHSDILHKTSKEFLSRKWYHVNGNIEEKGAKFTSTCESFLNIYLNTVKNEQALDIIEDYVQNGVVKIAQQANGTPEERFVTLTKHTLSMHFRYIVKMYSSKGKPTY